LWLAGGGEGTFRRKVRVSPDVPADALVVDKLEPAMTSRLDYEDGFETVDFDALDGDLAGFAVMLDERAFDSAGLICSVLPGVAINCIHVIVFLVSMVKCPSRTAVVFPESFLMTLAFSSVIKDLTEAQGGDFNSLAAHVHPLFRRSGPSVNGRFPPN
jgi:hypothetical protein